jgi:membrane protease YdiL (CAAX protease family)
MAMHSHLGRLFALIGLVVGGLLLTALFSLVLKMLSGMSLADLQEQSASGALSFTAGETRALLIAQHLLGFILPGLVFGLIYYRPSVARNFDLHVAPSGNLALFGILFLLAAYPLVNLSFMANELLPMPEWAATLEEEARQTMELIIDMPTPWIFLLNLLIIGILPGIGEELVFRGILQKEMGGLLRSPVIAIWVSAFIFSAIHFQLEGLFPRMVLGVVLGYLYYWTKNLWVPIIAHAMNNGVQVMLIYFTGMDMTEVDEQTNQLQAWMIPLSVGAMYLLARSITKQKQLG